MTDNLHQIMSDQTPPGSDSVDSRTTTSLPGAEPIFSGYERLNARTGKTLRAATPTHLGRMIDLLRNRGVLAILFLFSVACVGFSLGVDDHIRARSGWWGFPDNYTCRALIEALTPAGVLLGLILAIRLTITSQADAGWTCVFFVLWGIVIAGVFYAGFQGGHRVGPHLKMTYRESTFIGITVLPAR